MSEREIVRWMAATLRGREVSLPDATFSDVERVAAKHGMSVLLFGSNARQALAAAIVRDRELDAIVDSFNNASLSTVVLKGAALGRTVYASPAMRPRCDADLLIRASDVSRAAPLLTSLGYRIEPNGVGEQVIRQQLWRRVDNSGVQHDVDLHWAISNRPRFARLFVFDDLFARGVAFGDRQHVRAIGLVDALRHAAIHLAGHHDGEERLIWLYDIHLLAERLGDEQVAELKRGFVAQEVSAALNAARALFEDGANVPAGLPRQSTIHRAASDIRWTHGVRARIALLSQHLFPSADHVLRKYGSKHRAVLPLLYARRAGSGVAKVIREIFNTARL